MDETDPEPKAETEAEAVSEPAPALTPAPEFNAPCRSCKKRWPACVCKYTVDR